MDDNKNKDNLLKRSFFIEKQYYDLFSRYADLTDSSISSVIRNLLVRYEPQLVQEVARLEAEKFTLMAQRHGAGRDMGTIPEPAPTTNL